jgi:hypothetical protein
VDVDTARTSGDKQGVNSAGGQLAPAAEKFEFMFVRYDDRRDGQQRGRKFSRGRRIENGRAAAYTKRLKCLHHTCERNLELCERDRAGRSIAWPASEAIGSGNDDDGVLGIVVDLNEGPTGGHAADGVEPTVVDAFGNHDVSERGASGVIADGADQCNGRSGAGRSDGLIQTFPAGKLLILRPADRFTRLREPGGANNEIEIQAPDDNNVEVSQLARARTPIGAMRR